MGSLPWSLIPRTSFSTSVEANQSVRVASMTKAPAPPITLRTPTASSRAAGAEGPELLGPSPDMPMTARCP